MRRARSYSRDMYVMKTFAAARRHESPYISPTRIVARNGCVNTLRLQVVLGNLAIAFNLDITVRKISVVPCAHEILSLFSQNRRLSAHI